MTIITVKKAPKNTKHLTLIIFYKAGTCKKNSVQIIIVLASFLIHPLVALLPAITGHGQDPDGGGVGLLIVMW